MVKTFVGIKFRGWLYPWI